MNVFALHEGIFSIDNQHHLTALNKTPQQQIKNALVIGINPFLIRDDNDIILIDTGLGTKNEQGVFHLHHHLAQHDLSIYDVTKVIISHFHYDHISGMVYADEALHQYQLHCPHAQYFVSQKGYEHFLETTNTENDLYKKMVYLGQDTSALFFFEDKHNQLSPAITVQETNAHSPHHHVITYHHGDKVLFYGGDDAPQLIQMQRKVITKYDHNPQLCADLRALWWQKGNQHQWQFLFYHDTINPIYQPSTSSNL